MFHIETMSFDELVASGMIQMIDELVDKPYLEALKTIPVQPVKRTILKLYIHHFMELVLLTW